MASLYEFTVQAWPHLESKPFVDNFHIGAVCDHLEAVSRGEIMKLLINIPPGCTKSLLLIMWFCWEWANDPTSRWMFNSYDQRLSTRDSVKCRSLINSKWFQEQWGGKWNLTDDQNQKTYFENSSGGYRLATTPGGHGTGEHPDRIVVDDPNNVKQAESDGSYTETVNIWGTILRVIDDPGSTAPTDNYDITAVDEFGIDIFAAQRVDRDTANSDDICPGLPFTDGVTVSVMPVAVAGNVVFTIANAGASKVGNIVVIVKK